MWRWVFISGLAIGCATPEPEETPLEGPGFDEVTGALMAPGEAFTVVVTHLQVRNLPGPGGRFGELADEVGTDLFETEPPGFVGAAFRNVGRLNWWTMTVWDTEYDMLSWAVQEPHATAMAEFRDITTGGENTKLLMTPDELPLAWDDALELLLTEPRVIRGETRWFTNGGEL